MSRWCVIVGLAVASLTGRPTPVHATPLPASVPRHLLRPVDDGDVRARLDLAATIDRLAVSPPPREETLVSPPREAVRLYLLARADMLAGRPLVAVTRLERAQELDPDSPEILRTLAAGYAAVGNEARARETYRRLRAAAPDDREALFVLGIEAVETRDFERGATLLATARAAGPLIHDPGATRLADAALQTAFAHLGYHRASMEAGRAAVEAGPMPAPSRERMRLALFFRSTGARWQAIGDAACRIGAYDEALEAYDESRQRPRADPVAVLPRLLYVHRARGDEAAAADVLGVLLADPSSAIDDVALAEFHAYARQTSVPPALMEILATRLQTPPVPTGLRRVQAAFADRDEAIEILRETLTDDPRSLGAAADLLAREASRSGRTAIEAAAQLIEMAPDRAEAIVDRLIPALTAVESIAPGRPREAEVVTRVLQTRGGRGEAWSTL
ncbi:MAG: tetratricopeptide repeat protein, partial [Phycisphaerae bacterium]|nr:tetratricopeptide repeat protein [Phycisphaerae bacterium]